MKIYRCLPKIRGEGSEIFSQFKQMKKFLSKENFRQKIHQYPILNIKMRPIHIKPKLNHPTSQLVFTHDCTLYHQLNWSQMHWKYFSNYVHKKWTKKNNKIFFFKTKRLKTFYSTNFYCSKLFLLSKKKNIFLLKIIEQHFYYISNKTNVFLH